MKLRNPRHIRVVAFLASVLIRAWMATVRYRIINRDSIPHPADPDQARFVYAFWHESLLAPVRFKTRVKVLISKHADGELVAQAAQWLGFGVIRGSSTRGGSGALVELWDSSRHAHLIFHPDGPRGPRRQVQPGLIILASRSGLPIVPVGIAYSRAWRAKSWDRFAVPKPFCKCYVVTGEAVAIPDDIDRAGIETYRVLVENRMLQATAAAESEAVRGTPFAPHLFRKRGQPRARRSAGSPPADS